MQMKVIKLFWSQVQCHLESVLRLNTFSMDQACFQIDLIGLEPNLTSIKLKTYLRCWKPADFIMEC